MPLVLSFFIWVKSTKDTDSITLDGTSHILAFSSLPYHLNHIHANQWYHHLRGNLTHFGLQTSPLLFILNFMLVPLSPFSLLTLPLLGVLSRQSDSPWCLQLNITSDSEMFTILLQTQHKILKHLPLSNTTPLHSVIYYTSTCSPHPSHSNRPEEEINKQTQIIHIFQYNE